jgi:hypothetical protein
LACGAAHGLVQLIRRRVARSPPKLRRRRVAAGGFQRVAVIGNDWYRFEPLAGYPRGGGRFKSLSLRG